MTLLWQTIKDNLIIHSERDDRNKWPSWHSYPLWNGAPMEPFYGSNCGCRQLFKLNVFGIQYLLKIDTDAVARFKQCPSELKLWQNMKAQHRQYFVPIICGESDAEPSWLVCPLVRDLRDRVPKPSHLEIVEDLRKRYNLDDLSLNKNWFIHYNKPLIVDYGVSR